MPLIAKKSAIEASKHNGQSVLIPRSNGLQPKRAAIAAANANPVCVMARKNPHLHKMISYYLKTFDNIISSRINRAIAKYRCLQVRPDEMREELNAKFQMKFSKAIIDRSIQMWRITDKSMNVYIQRMVDRLITDEIRAKSREQKYCRDVNLIDAVDNYEVVMDAVSNNSSIDCWLSENKFADGESNMMAKELWEKVLENLAQYEPDKLPILRKILDPDTDVNFSSPSVHALKITIKAILKELR